MKKIAISCIAASMLIQLSMADPANHSTHTPSHTHTAQALESSTQEVLDAMHAPMLETEFVESGEVNVDFIENMIPHHQGAIDAAKQILSITNNATITKIAKEIIATQEDEIKQFATLLGR